ncbi:unnamed protein product [Brassica napus]|uniref:Uncharacterized protein n=2 Tax=Brassica TaxID=3705 RepID=A0A3P6EY86_BRAOL|nr:unnamed protein product [Brassica napus]VDD39844.1 unnamed protein product [Brassica oleracea]
MEKSALIFIGILLFSTCEFKSNSFLFPCKKNSDCARLKCPSPLGHPTCVKGGCECPFEEHTVLPADDTNCGVAACFDYCKAKGEEQASRPHRPLPQPQTPADAITVRTDAVWLPVRNLAGLGWVVLSSPCNIPHKNHLEFVASPLMAEGLALREAVRSCALDYTTSGIVYRSSME